MEVINLKKLSMRKNVRAPLSKELREKYGTRTVRVRKGDTIKVVRGDYKNVEGKVERVDPKNGFIYVENVTAEKVDGSKYLSPLKPSKILIQSLNLDDKLRRKFIEQRK
jgi:large subunit ribosomal protein L24